MKTAAAKLTRTWASALTDYVTALAWSPDGAWLAAASAAGEVVLHSLSNERVSLRPADGQAMSVLGFSPEGRFLAAAGQSGEVCLWDLHTQPYTPILAPSHPGHWIDQLAWHPSHSQLAYGVSSQVQIWDAAARRQIARLEFADSSVLHLAWHPQGERLAVSGHGGMKVWPASDWSAPPRLIAVPGASLHGSWSADGGYLASGNLDRTLTVAEWDSPPPWLMQGFPGKVRQIAWATPLTPAGSPLVAAACVEGVIVWQRDSPTGGWKSRVLQHHQQRVNAIAFQPRSLLLASVAADGTVGLWAGGKTLAQSLRLTEGGTALAWHPQADRLALGGSHGSLSLWQAIPQAQGFG